MVRLISSAVSLTLLRKAINNFCDLMKTIPMLSVYRVVKTNGFVMQYSFVKNVKGVIIKVTACIDICKMETLKSDVVTIGVFLLIMKVANVTIAVNRAASEMDPIM